MTFPATPLPAGPRFLRRLAGAPVGNSRSAIVKVRQRGTAWRSLGLAGLLALCCGAVVALLPSPPPESGEGSVVRPPAPSAPAWVAVVHPFAMFDLTGGPFAKLPLHYRARRDTAGGARDDTLLYGDPHPGAAFLTVNFARQGRDPAPDATLFVEAVRLAAGAGLAVTRSALSHRIGTRFGPFEVAAVDLGEAGRAARCLAFRLAAPGSRAVLRITGLACGLDGATLACTLDRLDLVSAGDDEALRAVFVAAERRRRSDCAAPWPAAAGDVTESADLRGAL